VAHRLEDLAIPVYRNRGGEIHGSDCSDVYWYQAVSGVARCYIVLQGGRRQILDLLLPGDFFGFTGPKGHFYGVDAVVEGTSVACYPRGALQALADSDRAVAHEIREMMFGAMARSHPHILILGRMTAREKVGAFLLRIMQRATNDDSDRLVLPTSRYDIADYLALSVETVSRALTDLTHRGLISLVGPRRVRVVDRPGLDERPTSDCNKRGRTVPRVARLKLSIPQLCSDGVRRLGAAVKNLCHRTSRSDGADFTP
jgi:CRP/FNR family transcriptional regulator, nitrogen fixation regulation protein